MRHAKYFLAAIILLLLSLILLGCASSKPWTLIDEGNLTNIKEISGYTALTFDNERVAILKPGYALYFPTTIILNNYYYLYKEQGDAVWRGYHLVESRQVAKSGIETLARRRRLIRI